MALMDSYWEKQQAKEQARKDAAAQKEERRLSFLADARKDLGIDFDEMDRAALAESIRGRARDVSDGIAEHEWNRTITQVMRDEDRLAGDDLLRIIINQNWILIQQNELIARLLGEGK